MVVIFTEFSMWCWRSHKNLTAVLRLCPKINWFFFAWSTSAWETLPVAAVVVILCLNIITHWLWFTWVQGEKIWSHQKSILSKKRSEVAASLLLIDLHNRVLYYWDHKNLKKNRSWIFRRLHFLKFIILSFTFKIRMFDFITRI